MNGRLLRCTLLFVLVSPGETISALSQAKGRESDPTYAWAASTPADHTIEFKPTTVGDTRTRGGALCFLDIEANNCEGSGTVSLVELPSLPFTVEFHRITPSGERIPVTLPVTIGPGREFFRYGVEFAPTEPGVFHDLLVLRTHNLQLPEPGEKRYLLEGTAGLCDPDDHTICLNRLRFQVQVTWRDFENSTGPGVKHDADLGPDGANVWFFSQDNPEMLIKVLDGCSINDHFWVFFAAATNVEFNVTVTDTESGEERQYLNPLGHRADAITDTAAFATCP